MAETADRIVSIKQSSRITSYCVVDEKLDYRRELNLSIQEREKKRKKKRNDSLMIKIELQQHERTHKKRFLYRITIASKL